MRKTWKRLLSFVMVLAMLLTVLPVATPVHAAEGDTTLYLVPNANWKADGARFAVYYWTGTGDGWADAANNGEGYYEAAVPAEAAGIIFCRMNPNAAENSWDNKWNQSTDLTVPTDGSNCYTVAEDTWDAGGGTWSTYTPKTVLYLKPNSNWLLDGARFAAYFFGNGEIWVDMTDEDGDGYYECVAPEGYPSVILCRMNPDNLTNSWDTKWNQTLDLTVPTDGTNCYTVPANTWDKGAGSWSVYNPAEEEVPGETEAPTEPEGSAADYYLIGNINGADYGCNDDYANLGEYKFVDGKLTATFTSDSYVFLKTGDNAGWYMAESYCADTTCTFKNTSEGAAEKMFVPGGVELTFTLVVNEDGTLTLSYVAEEPEAPVEATYIIAGSANLCGTAWDTANTDNQMTPNGDGTYSKTYEDVAPGTYEFKVTDGSWANSWGSGAGNYVFTVESAADVVITFDPITGVVDAYVEVTQTTLVHMQNTYGWDAFNAYFWNALNIDAAWPGETPAANAHNAGWYDQTVITADGVNAGLVLNNGAGSQSSDVEIPGGTECWITADGAVSETAPENWFIPTTVTLHFMKDSAWGSAIYLYTWGGVDNGAWPGKSVSDFDGDGWYDFTAETDSGFNFIFNDGGNQTSDLATGDISVTTELWVVGNEVYTEMPGFTAEFHFLKPDSWGSTIYAYAWDGSGSALFGEWPGTVASANADNEGWYDISIEMDSSDGFSIIFNDNNGNQTPDLATGTLSIKTELWAEGMMISAETPAGWTDPNRKIYVPGTFPGPSWDASSNQMTFEEELGLYTYTFKNVPAANYEYKIAVNGGWAENYGAGGVRDGSNIAVTVPETMDVTVYYNDDTHNSVTNVTYKFVDVSVSGTGIETTVLTDPGLTGIYSGTVFMAAGTYTDVVIDCGGVKYTFAEIVVEEDKDVTFYIDPITGIYYCNASDIPIDSENVYFNSQDEAYKAPYGAVAVGEEVTFSIATGEDITSAVLVIKGITSVPMEKGEDGKWTASATLPNLGEYDYYFALSNGSNVAIYGDDDGFYGEGTVTDLVSVIPYDLVVYEAGFETPDWMKNAVIYQIFPDRFFDGDESNNEAQTWARGDVDYEYITDWYTLPENPEQEAMLDKDTYLSSGAHYGDGEWSNEIYGGDLKGITERIDYLKALGVNVIYLNPVFWSISNHRYDAVDYSEIDPILGTLGDFEELVAIAEANDMHIILDGVFNHVSDDSVYFDRYFRFLPDAAEKYDGKIGAYPYWEFVYDYMESMGVDQATAEAATKEFYSEHYGITDYSYTEWFAVSSTKNENGVYSYEGWWGYDSMPVIKSTNGSEYQTGNWAEEIISGDSSINAYWISKGMDGWRLDVANEVSDETWQNFRDSVKALDSEAVIIGEIWDDATKYLMGDMYDSVMNYLFRNAATSYAMGTNAADTTKALERIRERYPEEAFYAMMNLVGSHDTSRLLSYLNGVGDDRSDKTFDAAFPTYEKTSDLAKQRQYLVSFLQFTYAGAPTIYYGDEIGMVGSDDPDDRRAFEWGRGNQELVEWYARLAAIREAYPALRTGSVVPMDLGSDDLLAYVRADAANTLTVIANNSASAQSVTLEGSYVDLVTGEAFSGTVPAMNGVILVAEDEVKAISVNTADLAPAYDPAYIVAERAHVHKYVAQVSAPTCAEPGRTTYTCFCGDSYAEEGEPALGHSYDHGCCLNCGEFEPSYIDIVTQPVDAYPRVYEYATFVVEAVGADLTYQWYYSSDNGETWAQVSENGDRNDLFVEFKPYRVNYLYRCKVTNAAGYSLFSDAARLEGYHEMLTVNSYYYDYVGNVGDEVTFTVDATGNGVVYQWYYSADNGETWTKSYLPGYNTNTLTTVLREYRDGYQFKCIVNDVFGEVRESCVMSMSIQAGPVSIYSQPQSVENGILGQLYTFSVEASGENLTYRWEYSTDGGETWQESWNDGYNTDTLTVRLRAERDGYLYRCVVTSGLKMSETSETATLALQDSSVRITGQPESQEIVSGQTASFHVEATGTDLTYRWYRSNDGGETWNETWLGGYDTDTLSFVAVASRAAQYKCIVTDGSGFSVETDAVTLTVK